MDFVDRYFGLTPDPISKDRFLVSSPFGLFIILAFYALFVKVWGPRFMKNRKAFELRGLLIAYNSFQVIVSIYIVVKVLTLSNHVEVIGMCLRVDPKNPKALVKQVDLFHLYCMMKLVDLLDTVFFVLRKRYKQVTFLHFYHHLMVAAGAFLALRYCSYGHANMVGVINSFVHAVMYSYYLLSSLRSDVQGSLWWKKYITLLQMLQFVVLSVYLVVPLLHGDNCGYELRLLEFVAIQNVIMLILFSNFYIKTYIKRPKHKTN